MVERDAEFLEFVAAHRGRMLRTARLLTTGDAHAAEDIVQTALTKLYVHWSKVARADGPTRYADRTLLNTFINERKRPWRQRETSVAELADPEPRPGPDPADRLTVLAALAELPRRQRIAVVLRYFRDLDAATVADLMGCSEGTVRSQATRGLHTLRNLIAEPVDDLESAR